MQACGNSWVCDQVATLVGPTQAFCFKSDNSKRKLGTPSMSETVSHPRTCVGGAFVYESMDGKPGYIGLSNNPPTGSVVLEDADDESLTYSAAKLHITHG